VHSVQIALKKTWKKFQLMKISEEARGCPISDLLQLGFKPHFNRMKSYKVAYHLKIIYGGPINLSSLCSTRLESALLRSTKWLLLDRDNYKRRWRMTYFIDISSMLEFKAYEGTKEKLGGFD
jgi:hypothetical protein